MPDPSTSDATQSAEELLAIVKYAAAMMKNGNKVQEVQHDLLMKGLAPEVVTFVTDEAIKFRQAEARRSMLYGALWCVGGLLFSYVMYSLAKPGETYTVAMGAIVFGGWQVVKGFFRHVNPVAR